jgi:hypothetical protein
MAAGKCLCGTTFIDFIIISSGRDIIDKYDDMIGIGLELHYFSVMANYQHDILA